MYASNYWISVKYIYVKLFDCFGHVYGVFDRYGSLEKWKQLMFWVLGFSMPWTWYWCNSGHLLEIKTMCLYTLVCECTYRYLCLSINVRINICEHIIYAFVVRVLY
jgi:hypothetical protein